METPRTALDHELRLRALEAEVGRLRALIAQLLIILVPDEAMASGRN